EALPGEKRDRTRAEQRPERHFDRPGVGRRDDPDPVRRRDAKHFARQFDRMAQPGLAELRAVGAAERAEGEMFGAPAGRLRARAGREKGACRTDVRFNNSHVSLLAESSRRVGTAWPAAGLKGLAGGVNAAREQITRLDPWVRCNCSTSEPRSPISAR